MKWYFLVGIVAIALTVGYFVRMQVEGKSNGSSVNDTIADTGDDS